jgi:anti-sigma-K factor RskA
VVAAAVDRVRRDAVLSAALVARGRRHLADFDASRTKARYVEVLEALDKQELCPR